MTGEDIHRLLKVEVEGKIYGYQFYCPHCEGLHTIHPRDLYKDEDMLDNPTTMRCVWFDPEDLGHENYYYCNAYICSGRLISVSHYSRTNMDQKSWRAFQSPISLRYIERKLNEDGTPMGGYPKGYKVYPEDYAKATTTQAIGDNSGG